MKKIDHLSFVILIGHSSVIIGEDILCELRVSAVKEVEERILFVSLHLGG